MLNSYDLMVLLAGAPPNELTADLLYVSSIIISMILIFFLFDLFKSTTNMFR